MAGRERYTPTQVAEALRETKGMQFLAAKRLGCSHDTITRYIKKHPSVKAAAEEQRGEMVDTAELKLWQSIQNGEAWGISLCLKTLGKDRGYVERQEHTGKDGDAIAVTRLPSKAPSRAEWEAQNRNGQAVIHEATDADTD